MADTADTPPAGSSEFTPAPSSGTVKGLEPVRSPISLTPADAAPAYRPLSMLAIVGFGLAILYSFYLSSMTVFTYFSGDALFLPLWTLMFPVAILLVCWFARWSVLNSEGTLGGERLTNWGMGLTVVFCLAYWSYHAATFIALRQQAVSFVNAQFIPALSKGKVEEAFILTYQEPRPAVNEGLRKYIEANLNAPGSQKVNGAGRFTQFSESPYIRWCQMSPGKVQTTLKSIGSPVLDKRALQVPLLYRVETPLIAFDLQVIALANDTRSKDSPGRHWQIEMDRTGMVKQSETYTDEGALVVDKVEPIAKQFFSIWVMKLTAIVDPDGAYRVTLPAEEYQKLMQMIGGKSETDLRKEAETNPDLRAYFQGLDNFRNGSIVRNEDKFTIGNESMRGEVIAEVKKRFQPAFATSTWITPTGSVPLYENDGKKIRFTYELLLQLLPKYIASASVVVEADANILKEPGAMNAKAWHVAAMKLVRANAAPKADSKAKGGMGM